MPFGKHKGEPLSAIPTFYLEWLSEPERELREPLKSKVASELRSRKQKDASGPETADMQKAAFAIVDKGSEFWRERVKSDPHRVELVRKAANHLYQLLGGGNG